MSIFDIKSPADLRNYIYVILPVVTALLVSYGVFDATEGALWVALVTAIVGPGLAFIYTKTVDTFRAAFYALLAAIQAIVVGYGLVTDTQIGVWMPVITTIVGAAGGAVASRHVKNSNSDVK